MKVCVSGYCGNTHEARTASGYSENNNTGVLRLQYISHSSSRITIELSVCDGFGSHITLPIFQ